MRRYFYSLLNKYLSLYIRQDNKVIDLDSLSDALVSKFKYAESISWGFQPLEGEFLDADFIILNGSLHYVREIDGYLTALHTSVSDEARLIILYYSSLWKPLLSFASLVGIRNKTVEPNWLAHEDVANFLHLANWEPVKLEQKILLPVYIPFISTLINRYIAPLPVFRWFALVNILIARRVHATTEVNPVPSVSIIVPARNEAGHIDEIVRRLPIMGPQDELIFVEGGSSDDTWFRIEEVQRKQNIYPHSIIIAQQDGKGKGDAVRKGFALATNEILMILDADLTVPPEELPKFYRAIIMGKGEFINGSRLVYPMEKGAMRFMNLLGNKFFAQAFSFVLGQRFKDTLCGTKVLSYQNYKKIAAYRSYFGNFDPFGDFDLIFGAARMGLKIVEIPISYRERQYGDTNISRWRHGYLLLRMLLFASKKFKFL